MTTEKDDGVRMSFVCALLLICVLVLMGVQVTQNSKIHAELIQANKQPPPRESEPPKYEYKIISPLDSVFDISATIAGRQGWKIVSARRATGTYTSPNYELIMMREIQE